VASDLATGLFSLGGVALGAGLAAGVTELQERRRAKRDARAARLVAAADLAQALDAIEDVQLNLEKPLGGNEENREHEWPAGWERVSWTESWTGYRDRLVDGLAAPDFALVARAFGSLVQFEKSLSASKRPFVPGDQEFVYRVARRVRRGLEILPSPDPGLAEDGKRTLGDGR
jgi:hypothetical protein